MSDRTGVEASVGEQEELTGSQPKRNRGCRDMLPWFWMGETSGSGTLELLESWCFDIKKNKTPF